MDNENMQNDENFVLPEEPEAKSGSKSKKVIIIVVIVAALFLFLLCCILPALYIIGSVLTPKTFPVPTSDDVAYKPVIYLYPEQEIRCDVSLRLPGSFTYTYPAIEPGQNGFSDWSDLIVAPDGTIIGANGKQYYCLFWEAKFDEDVRNELGSFDTGFCVKGSETEAFLEDALKQQGLNDREIQEFLIFWVPKMQDSEYNLISFPNEKYSELVPLTVSETPDTVVRVFMTWKASDSFVDLEPQTYEAPERTGFTIVEWGGEEF